MQKMLRDIYGNDMAAWKMRALFVTSLPFLITARMIFQYYPSLWACALFWCIALADEPLRLMEMGGRRRVLYGLSIVGGLMNAIATLANGGHMPVLMSVARSHEFTADSVWVPLTNAHRLAWLCDIHPGATSLGDWFIFACLGGLLLNWTAEKIGVLQREAFVSGKRIPGIGIG